MIFGAFLTALGEIGDPRFRRVLWLGIGLSLLLLAAIYALMLLAIQALVPETVAIPVLGEVGGLGAVLSWASLLLMIVLSVFLMMPVASVFAGMFLEDVAAAVEARHYPALPPADPVGILDALADGAGLFGALVAANILALLLYPFAGPLAPVLFWAVNGYLLGREYFSLVAMRRIGRAEARALRARHAGRVWLAGTLMAAPLSVPLVNLVVPVLGVATFTHLFHRLRAEDAASSRNP